MSKNKEKLEKFLKENGVPKDPWTAEMILLDKANPNVSAKVLEAIFYLKIILVFEAFADTERGEQ